MTIKEFWRIYSKSKNLYKDFDKVYDFFSNGLPAGFVDDYDVDEVVLETLGHTQDAKDFEKALKFIKLLQTKYPELYDENFQYIDEFLVDYYCYFNDNLEIANAFSNFMNNPLKGYEQFLVAFSKILFYQHCELLDTVITKTYSDIKNSDELLEGADFDLAISKFYINLENFYHKAYENTVFDQKAFSESIIPFGFDFPEEALVAIGNGLFTTEINKESLIDNFLKNRGTYRLTIEALFLKEMKTRNFHFALSGWLWGKMLNFWEGQTKKKKIEPDLYFAIKAKEFEEYMSGLGSSMFFDNKSEMIAALWGSVYIYDFLLSIGLINETTYENFKKISQILKGKVIGQITSTLWNSNFVHHWTKPDSISETEFREEEKIFNKSLLLRGKPFSALKGELDEELKNIGELSTYIIQGGKPVIEKLSSLYNDLFEHLQSKKDSYQDDRETGKEKWEDGEKVDDDDEILPINQGKKVGRNEPCPCGSGKKYKKCCEKK